MQRFPITYVSGTVVGIKRSLIEFLERCFVDLHSGATLRAMDGLFPGWPALVFRLRAATAGRGGIARVELRSGLAALPQVLQTRLLTRTTVC